MKRTLRIVAVGLRGIPNIQGGIETHVAELYPRLARLGVQTTVVGRVRFRPAETPATWRGVRLHWLWSPRRSGLEAAVHAILSVLYAALRRPDIIHVHAIGPAIAVPLARLLGLRVVFTHHGQDYRREKWGATARWILRRGERWGINCSHARIAVSSTLRDQLEADFARAVAFIPNGMAEIERITDQSLILRFGLEPQRFVIQVSRLVPEKRQLDLIEAFQQARLEGWKLVLVGDGQGAAGYAQLVQQAAAGNPSIVCTGALPAPAVYQLLSHAGSFVLPSSHEGLPIALLEAVRLQVPALASDIPGNREIGLNPEAYFAVGDIDALTRKLRTLAGAAGGQRLTAARYGAIGARYDWDQIALATLAVMEKAALTPEVTPAQ